MTPDARRLLGRITAWSKTLKGTRPFWGTRRGEPNAFVKCLGSPHLFLTLSAADLHWDHLMRNLPRYEEWSNGTAYCTAKDADCPGKSTRSSTHLCLLVPFSIRDLQADGALQEIRYRG